MKKISIMIILVGLIGYGIYNANHTYQNKVIENKNLIQRISALQSTLKDEQTQSKYEIDTLNKKIAEYTTKITNLENSLNTNPSMQKNVVFTKYPTVKKYCTSNWTNLFLSNGEEFVEITNPTLINQLKTRCNSIKEYTLNRNLTEEIYRFKLVNKDTSMNVYVTESGILQFDELAASHTFLEDQNFLSEIGKGFSERPKYKELTETNVFSKMENSGVVHDSIGRLYRGPIVGNTLLSFIDYLAPEEIPAPETIDQVELETYTFYYYGSQIKLNIYEQMMHIKDDTMDQWYKLNGDGSSIVDSMNIK